jgi:CheY-like chemotaxis protein
MFITTYQKISGTIRIRSGQYDLVILDIRMPVFDGFLLFQKIRKEDSRVRVRFLTASEFYREQIRKEHGFDNFRQELFLRKPIENENLVHVIEKMFESG